MKKTISNSHYVNILKIFIKSDYVHTYYNNRFVLFIEDEQFPLFVSPDLYQKLIFLKSRSALVKGD